MSSNIHLSHRIIIQKLRNNEYFLLLRSKDTSITLDINAIAN